MIGVSCRSQMDGIYFAADHHHITDGGIGIPKNDLERIFEKGFTGQNGRTNTRATVWSCQRMVFIKKAIILDSHPGSWFIF